MCSPSFVADVAALSSTVRALLARIERSDLVVYVRCVSFKPAAFAGRLLFVTAAGAHRYLMIEIRSPEQWHTQATTMAHELQHAVEIADAPWVRTDRQMAQHYRLTGIAVAAQPLTFDTEAARQVEWRVHRELAATQSAAVLLARRR